MAIRRNVRTAEFGREAYRLVDWMQATPAFADDFKHNEKRIRAGAQRLDAFYLLDGGNYAAALRAYAKAFSNSPRVVLREAHRVIFAILGLLGLGRLRELYMNLRVRSKSFHPEGHEEREGKP